MIKNRSELLSHGFIKGRKKALDIAEHALQQVDPLAAVRRYVRLDGNPRNMHHKVILIDNQIVILGSYNFSRNAEEFNDENTLIIHNGEMAAQVLTEFERVWAKAPAQ